MLESSGPQILLRVKGTASEVSQAEKIRVEWIPLQRSEWRRQSGGASICYNPGMGLVKSDRSRQAVKESLIFKQETVRAQAQVIM